MSKKRIFSGIQPSGVIHIGNYLGAIKQWVELSLQEGLATDKQNQYECIFSIVDLHAITVPQDPNELKKNIYNLLALYLACGIDPKRSPIFVQSQISAHAELTWILNTISYMGELSRMTQFKDKSAKINTDKSSVGLFDYPVLMAADILLYKTNIVPVGEDQKQHVELCRNLAQRFNNRFGETFIVPEVKIRKESARIMGLDNPEKKMSKSAASQNNYIAMTDTPETIIKKISRAVTDSGKDIVFDEKRAGLYNLLNIYQIFSKESLEVIEKKFAGRGYGDFKKDLANLIIESLSPIQEKYAKLIADKSYLDQVLKEGREAVAPIAEQTLQDVKKKIGLIV